MLRALRTFLDQIAGAPAAPLAPAETVQVATAVLLVEVMRADAEVDPEEHATALRYLQGSFGLSGQEVEELLEAAHQRSIAANDFFAFTSVLNERLTHEQKIAVVEQMWRIAHVDASADAGESHIISKVAGLLHVTHGEYIAAKMRARAQ